ncbi:HPr family phosphocarrier protein [Vibrio sonorensis]|uniref:HPr family phosphocarrier protein n=1 Tax=Vibrio sonorensis TaxID=1004316 RepID=UPI0008D9DFA7|nr:HPr family phosphocarrier protein [Vibrio sonorensis]
MQQQSRTVLIQNRLGLHARAAVKLVELAQSYEAVLSVQNDDGKEATADSVMGLLMLESAQGEYVTISAEGSDAAAALEAVCHLIEDKFEEED